MSQVKKVRRSLPIGAELVGENGTHFRVWAPARKRVELVLEDGPTPISLEHDEPGYFSGLIEGVRAGARYRFRLDGEDKLYPDPASRYQPDGPNGPSIVVDPRPFKWTDANWQGITAARQVVYEMHIGTFTAEGTWAAASAHLEALKEVGITCLEVMPVNEFAGKFGWGYDGVDLFAPTRLYGTPDEMRLFIDRAHAIGLAVILDVVYNHIGPDGNYLSAFCKDFFTQKHKTDWGPAINFDGENSAGVREFFLANTQYWIEEFHVDGYRFDATQAIIDCSPVHILGEISQRARKAAGNRSIYLVNENEPQHTRLVRPVAAGGLGMDALWNDDLHHSAMVVLSGRSEAYYSDHAGAPQEFISAAKWGYLFQGQRYRWQNARRGTSSNDLPSTAYVNYIQNHDQVANSGKGLRAHQIASLPQYRAMTVVILLMPQTPMLFQGQEWAASSTFHYFADHEPELAKLVRKGRAKELSQFPSIALPDMQAGLLDPDSEDTFTRSKLDHAEKKKPFHAQMLDLHRQVLALRHRDSTFSRVQQRGDVDGAVLGHDAFVLRYFGEIDDGSDDRLLVVNFGSDLELHRVPEPLLAAPTDYRWQVILSSEEPRFGGAGAVVPETPDGKWFLTGRCTFAMRAVAASDLKKN